MHLHRYRYVLEIRINVQGYRNDLLNLRILVENFFFQYTFPLSPFPPPFPTGKTTNNTQIAVRETDVSQQSGHPSEAPEHHRHYGIDGFKGGALNGPHYAERHQQR